MHDIPDRGHQHGTDARTPDRKQALTRVPRSPQTDQANPGPLIRRGYRDGRRGGSVVAKSTRGHKHPIPEPAR
jgi:hypothetical protein